MPKKSCLCPVKGCGVKSTSAHGIKVHWGWRHQNECGPYLPEYDTLAKQGKQFAENPVNTTGAVNTTLRKKPVRRKKNVINTEDETSTLHDTLQATTQKPLVVADMSPDAMRATIVSQQAEIDRLRGVVLGLSKTVQMAVLD